MNYFEQELQRLVKNCPELKKPVFTGRACFAELGGDVRVKLQFITLNISGHYDAVRATVLNRTEGEVDTALFRFGDIWGSKAVSNPNFRSGVIPYIWTDAGKSDWYVYRPTEADFRQLAVEVNAYAGVFVDRSVVREQAKAADKDSVVQKLRESKPRAAVPKDKPRRPDPER